MTLHEKLAAIMSEVQYLAKDDKVEFNKTSYKALSEEKVTVVMREKMVKYGLLVYPIAMVSNRAGSITHVDVTYRIVNAENPAEYIDVVSCGDGADTQDKGAGKAMTYAFKYMWLRVFAIPTGEDPDKVSSEQLDAEEAERKEEERKQQNAPLVCENCGAEIRTNKKKSWAEKSIATYGKVLCLECMNA